MSPALLVLPRFHYSPSRPPLFFKYITDISHQGAEYVTSDNLGHPRTRFRKYGLKTEKKTCFLIN